MSNNAVAITVIVMAGLLLSVAVWQMFAIAKEHTRGRSYDATTDELRRRVEALEKSTTTD